MGAASAQADLEKLVMNICKSEKVTSYTVSRFSASRTFLPAQGQGDGEPLSGLQAGGEEGGCVRG